MLNTSPNWKVKVVPVGPSAKSFAQTLECAQGLQETRKEEQVTTCLVFHKSLAVKIHKRRRENSAVSRPEHLFLCRAPSSPGIVCKEHKKRGTPDRYAFIKAKSLVS